MTSPLWLDVAFSHTEVPLKLKDTAHITGGGPGDVVCCVIDVLRATSTIVAALGNECAGIHPCPSPGAALEKAAALRRELGEGAVLLGGEQDAQPIEGFDGGNSPLEYTRGRIGGRRLVLSTSNGTKALAAAAGCGRVFIAAFANISAAAQRLAEEFGEKRALLIACSGEGGGYCEEDAVAAGEIISMVKKEIEGAALSDTAATAVRNAESAGGDYPKMLRECEWGKHLAGLGLSDDVEFCARADWTDVVPEMKDGVILP
jgi:2-phosphosulfolactate phosphatase